MILPCMLMLGMLFSGFTSFGQSITSLIPEKKKDAAYTQAHQQQINNGVKATAKEQTTGASTITATPVSVSKTADYYNPSSLIYQDARTPRFPLTGNQQQDIANYNKAKNVWIANNKEEYKQKTADTESAADKKANAEKKNKEISK